MSFQTGKMDEFTERFRFTDTVRRNGSNAKDEKSLSQYILEVRQKAAKRIPTYALVI